MSADSPVVAFLPCRRGSQRVPEKNTRPFAGVQGGLVEIKLLQLIRCAEISEIVVSTNDPAVMAIGRSVAHAAEKPVTFVPRPEHLAASDASTDALIRYVPELILRDDAVVLWTHVTSPFTGAASYATAIQRYRQAVSTGAHDSLASVTRLQTFLWNQSGPVNYDRQAMKWPSTQHLPVWYELNSAIFLAARSVYVRFQDRIGAKPYLLELSRWEGLDIDWEEDFIFGEALWRAGSSGGAGTPAGSALVGS